MKNMSHSPSNASRVGAGPSGLARFLRKDYDSKGQFCSYWHQINEVYATDPTTLLEIGMGGGLVSGYLRRRGLHVTCVDIDADLGPNAVGTVTALPFASDSFDTVLCCEVLEHLPFELFASSLRQIARVSRRHVVLSLPQCRKGIYRIAINLPRLHGIDTMIELPVMGRPTAPHDPGHRWEIGLRAYRRRDVESIMRQSGLDIVRTFTVPEKIYHRFYLLRCSAKG